MKIFSSAYLPPISFFVELLSSEINVLDVHENYQRKRYYNRANILSPQGMVSLSVPVIKNKEKTEVKAVKYEASDWKNQHWKSIQSFYQNSPFFQYYKDEFKEILFTEYSTLHELNWRFIQFFIDKIDLSVALSQSEGYIAHNPDNDLDTRFKILPNKHFYKFLEYKQVFSEDIAFQSNLSILDALFNLGPQTETYLLDCINNRAVVSNKFRFPLD
jgi:hypothetical protein